MGIPGFFGFIKKYNNPNNKDSLIRSNLLNNNNCLNINHFFRF